MLISADARLPFPRALVYATYRDKLVDLVPYMPNIRAIRVKSRREEGNRVFCVNEWQGGGEIPPLARAFLSDEMLTWTENNVWIVEDYTLEWRITTHAFTAAVHCAGKNRFLEQNGTTVVENRGELIIDPAQIQGIPPFLVGQVAHLVEEVLGQRIQPNLLHLGEGVCRYLKREHPLP